MAEITNTRQALFERKRLIDQGATVEQAAAQVKLPQTQPKTQPKTEPKAPTAPAPGVPTKAEIQTARERHRVTPTVTEPVAPIKPTTITKVEPAPTTVTKVKEEVTEAAPLKALTADELFISKVGGQAVDLSTTMGKEAQKRFISAQRNVARGAEALAKDYKAGVLTEEQIQDIKAVDPDVFQAFTTKKQDVDTLKDINKEEGVITTPSDFLKSFSKKFDELAKGQADLIAQKQELLNTPEIKAQKTAVSDIDTKLEANKKQQVEIERDIRKQFSGKATEGFIQAKIRKELRSLQSQQNDLLIERNGEFRKLEILSDTAKNEFDSLVSLAGLEEKRLEKEFEIGKYLVSTVQSQRQSVKSDISNYIKTGILTGFTEDQINALEKQAGMPEGSLKAAQTKLLAGEAADKVSEETTNKVGTQGFKNREEAMLTVGNALKPGAMENSVGTFAQIKSLNGTETSKIGNGNIILGSTHTNGLDIDGYKGQELNAFGSLNGGVVKSVGDTGKTGWGKNIVVETADGYQFRLSHLDDINVKEGDLITTDMLLGTIGTTGSVEPGPEGDGSHLDVTVTKSGKEMLAYNVEKLINTGDMAINSMDTYKKDILTARVGKQIYGTRISDAEGKRVERMISEGLGRGKTQDDIIKDMVGYQVTKNVDLGNNLLNILRVNTGEDGLQEFDMIALSGALNDDRIGDAIQTLENNVLGSKKNQKIIEKSEVVYEGTASKAIDALNNVLEIFEELPGSGPVEGRWQQLKKKVTDDEPLSELEAEIVNSYAKYRNELLGSAVTDSEAKYLEPLLPSITDTEANFTAKVNTFKNDVLRRLNSSRKRMRLPLLTEKALSLDLDVADNEKQAIYGYDAPSGVNDPLNLF